MRVLFLTSRLPYPPYRGDKLKIFNLMKRVSRLHEVHLLSFVESGEEERLAENLRPYCRRIEVVRLPRWRSYLNCAWATLGRRPFQVAYFSSGAMERTLREMLDGERYDLVHVHLIRMAQYLADGGTAQPRVLDLTDAGSLYLQRFLVQTRNHVQRAFLRQEWKRLSRYERILERFDLSLVCSPVDRDVLRRHAPSADVRILSNGVDLEYFSPGDVGASSSRSIVFTGNMSYYPNADGAEYLVREILPIVRTRFPDVHLRIVGQSPPPSVRRLAGEGVEVTGFAQDIREFYLQSRVAVAPIRFGAGTLNKVLEPMALGIPVVATPFAVEGLPATDGTHVLIGDSPQAFAQAIIRLFEDAALWERVADQGRRLVRERYDWERIAAELCAYYEEVVTTGQRA